MYNENIKIETNLYLTLTFPGIGDLFFPPFFKRKKKILLFILNWKLVWNEVLFVFAFLHGNVF